MTEHENEKIKKAVLLYSGGLDTSVILKMLQEKFGCDVITLTLDVGQEGNDLVAIKKKALKLGAKKALVVDVKKEFADEYIAKAIKANALYEGVYPVSTAIARPLQAAWGVKIALKEKADAIVHGCSGKGNDQVRFDAVVTALAPHIKVVAPVRDWNLVRDEEIEYAKKNGIQIPVDKKNPFSVDENLWGRSSECGIIEHPDVEVPEDTVLGWVTPPAKAPDSPAYVKLQFDSGIPVALNGKKMELWKLIQKLNKIAGARGVGIMEHMEDRVVGLKSREYYECPAAAVILAAHKDLEKYVCTSHENHFKALVDQQWVNLAYAGLWHEPLMTALKAFIDKTNAKVCGFVTVKLFKGRAQVVARDSPYALYDLKLATYDRGHTFNQAAATGFIELFTLQTRMANKINKAVDGDANGGE